MRPLVDRQKVDILTSLASFHDQLCSTIALTSNCFGLSIAAFIGANLISTIFACFDLYSAMAATTRQDVLIGNCILANMWNFFLFCYVFLVACVCSWSKREAKSSSFILHKALHYQDNEGVQRKVTGSDLKRFFWLTNPSRFATLFNN